MQGSDRMKQAWILGCMLSLLMVMLKANASDGVAMPSSPTLLVFVSFSMPRQSLEAYLHDAKKIHATVVIRGLVDNSFKKTTQHMAELIQASGGEGMVLNPLWFKRFNIQRVPSVVIVPHGGSCFTNGACDKEHDYDQMSGDITLSAALKMLRDKGKVSNDIAQSALEKLQDVSHA